MRACPGRTAEGRAPGDHRRLAHEQDPLEWGPPRRIAAGFDGPGHGGGLLRPRGGHPEPAPAGAAWLGPPLPRGRRVSGESAGRIARGALNYPGIGLTEHGKAPEGFPCLVSWAHLGDGPDTFQRVARGILAWELQKRSG